ncbi:MAG TPA: endonuclease III [Gemmatimonadales bacterium]|nr:endonuclease III [Gemmatimonadales bacterium]
MKPARERIRLILNRLKRRYPEAQCSLGFGSPLELLVATILSAQCTDERVNAVTPALFARYRTARDYAEANPDELSEMIKSTGFFRNKTRSLIGMGTALVERHGGEVPRSMEELTAVPGVGRKTANVVLGNAFGIDEGVVVDTHVARLSQRLRLTRHTEAGKIERDLMALVPRKEWTLFPHLMIHHGRAVCQARKPRCEICPVNDLCPFPKGGPAGRRTGGPKGRRDKSRT